MESVRELVKEINEKNSHQIAISQKDEVKVMRCMLNDKDYEVQVYNKNGVSGTLSPYRESRELISSVIANATKISTSEADQLAEQYEFNKSESINMINISKEFINTYLETGRKLSFGGREDSDISIAKKVVKETTRKCPHKIGEDANGNAIYEHQETVIPAHNSLKVYSPFPEWCK